MALGAAFSWCLETNREVDVADVLSRRAFADSSGLLASGALRAAEAYRLSGASGFNGSPLFYALLENSGIFGGDPPTQQGIEETLQALTGARREISDSTPACADGELTKRELMQAIELARLGTLRLAAQNQLDAGDPAVWSTAIADALDEQRACWLARSRPGGLEDSLGKLSRQL